MICWLEQITKASQGLLEAQALLAEGSTEEADLALQRVIRGGDYDEDV